ncbi:MAG TPA: M20/M25/M40 family metallo-hydrolase, partial [Gemmataceae bacterium]|nr:M20/M25/M40 family metallo-hydrolase [Gemmataceae bacterium]
IWKARVRRNGPPVHEVMRPDEPSVIAAGAELVARLNRLGEKAAARSDPMAGRDSVFIGQIHSGEMYNQYPQECRLEGTRRWLPGLRREDVEAELRELFAGLARDTGAAVDVELVPIRDAFRLGERDPLAAAFQGVLAATAGKPLPVGAKPFCDDGNTFSARAGVAAITHGPQAGGAHTLEEWVSISDLERVALVYALTAAAYCDREGFRNACAEVRTEHG